MGTTFYFDWEVKLMEFIQNFMTPVWAKIMEFITFFGNDLCIVFFLGFIYWVYDKKQGIRFGVTLMTTDLVFPIVKNLALRRRPYMDHESIKRFVLIDKNADAMDIAAQGYSFPSGHSANAAAMTTSIARIFKKPVFVLIAIVLPILVGISRFALGVHYPTDVIAGLALGYGMSFFVPWLCSKVKNERRLYYIVFCILLLGVFICKSNDYYTALGSIFGMLIGSGVEEKYVNFKPTRNVLTAVLRVGGGVAIYFILNSLLKLPFSEELLSSASYAQFAIRFARYTIILFVESGIYPMCFGKVRKE